MFVINMSLSFRRRIRDTSTTILVSHLLLMIIASGESPTKLADSIFFRCFSIIKKCYHCLRVYGVI